MCSIKKGINWNISRIIKQYKEWITKTIRKPIWQKSYYDHIIRNEKDYYRIWKYIDENELIQMNENKTNINCEKPIYRNFHETIENTEFLIMSFLHFFNKRR